MTMVSNKTDNRTFKVGPPGRKKEIPPFGIADVDMSPSELAKNLFVKADLLEVSKGKPGPKPKSAPVTETAGDTEAEGNE